MEISWEEYFRDLAFQVSKKSKDRSTQIGAVIVGSDNQIISTGYNSFPRGIDDYNESRHERPEKYFWFEHAERNAIYNAALNGVSTKGATMYLSCDIPCADCARGIINAGIKKIVLERGGGVDMSKKFQWHESCSKGKEMLLEADVDIHYYQDYPFYQEKVKVEEIQKKAEVLKLTNILEQVTKEIQDNNPDLSLLQCTEAAWIRIGMIEYL